MSRILWSAESKPPRLGCRSDWLAHSRVQRHFRNFLARDAGAVIDKYRRCFGSLDHRARARVTCHVGAWVALLPWNSATCRAGKSNLSPVLLFVHFLRQQDLHQKDRHVTPWLWGVLLLVAARIKDHGVDGGRAMGGLQGAGMTCSDQLRLLECNIPHCVWQSTDFKQIQTTSEHQSWEARPETHAKWHDADGVCILESGVDRVLSPISHQEAAHQAQPSLQRSVGTSAAQKCQRAARLFYQAVARWSNAGPYEQKERVKLLESKLAMAKLHQDWWQLLSVLRQSVAALSPPRSKPQVAHDEGRCQSSCAGAVQAELRNIVLRAVEALRGFERDERVDSILEHVHKMIGRFEKEVGSLAHAAAGQSWCALRATLLEGKHHFASVGEARREVHAKCEHSCLTSVEAQRESPKQPTCPENAVYARRECSGTVAGRSRFEDGHYTPNSKMKALPTVQHRPSEAKTLKCSLCGHELISAWFFVHPQKEVAKVLVPCKGHYPCRKRLQRMVRYQVVDGTKSVSDNHTLLVRCQHGKRKDHCITCTPHRFCIHGSFGQNCKTCYPQRNLKRRRVRGHVG